MACPPRPLGKAGHSSTGTDESRALERSVGTGPWIYRIGEPEDLPFRKERRTGFEPTCIRGEKGCRPRILGARLGIT